MSYHERRLIRIKNYDYRASAIYFITICTNEKGNIFGFVKDGKMILNKFGIIARREWIKTARIRTNVVLDAFIIMPDHIHGIIWIRNPKIDHCRGMACHAHEIQYKFVNRQFGKPIKQSLSSIIGLFKSSASREINKNRRTPGKIIWQRNYFEHIIQNERELYVARQYIINNPKKYK
jgi:REP element-mobilizing transposase RayT